MMTGITITIGIIGTITIGMISTITIGAPGTIDTNEFFIYSGPEKNQNKDVGNIRSTQNTAYPYPTSGISHEPKQLVRSGTLRKDNFHNPILYIDGRYFSY